MFVSIYELLMFISTSSEVNGNMALLESNYTANTMNKSCNHVYSMMPYSNSVMNTLYLFNTEKRRTAHFQINGIELRNNN